MCAPRRGLCLSHHPLSPPRPASPLSFFLPHSLSKFENHVDAKFDLLIEGLNETYQKIEGAKGAVEVRREMRGEGEREMERWRARQQPSHPHLPLSTLSLFIDQGRGARQDGGRQDRHAAHGAGGQAGHDQGARGGRAGRGGRWRGGGEKRRERESGPRAFVRCAPVASFASSLSPILPPQNATFGVKDMAEDKVVGLVNITAGLKGEVADKIEGVMTGFKN